MKTITILFALVAGCVTEEATPDRVEYPTCEEAGCPTSPSGSPYQWEECRGEVCFCPTDEDTGRPGFFALICTQIWT